jgi:Xaa-Pro aminopeptidase
MDNEIKTKMHRVAGFLDRHRLDGVFLSHRASFAWITGGKDNHIAGASPSGVAGILVNRDSRRCFTNTIEGPRFQYEELAGTGIEVITYPWEEPFKGQEKLKELISGKKFAADPNDGGDFDRFGAGFVPLPRDFAELRWALTPEEIQRYKEGGRRTSQAMETACQKIAANMTEHEIAAVLDAEVRARGMLPVVTLVAADERVEKFRHPIPTENRVKRYCMLVSCASFGGLISNITRFVSFVPLTAELKKKHQAVCNVDAAVNLATAPGKTMGEMFEILTRAYADNGFPGQQALHHQGGSTGYAGRDVFTEPGLDVKLLADQAFAWNPSITGTKSEDTILCTSSGIEMITTISANWPIIRGHAGGNSLDRADILVR